MKTLLLLAMLCAAPLARAGTITNLTLSSISNQTVTRTISLGVGQSAAVIQFFGQPTLVTAIAAGVRVQAGQVADASRKFIGPASFEFSLNGESQPDGTYVAIITLEIDPVPAQPPPILNIPSNAVVIPADSAGPVTILLESSADLVTWNSALPGTCGTSSTNRFFRVRAVRAGNP